ncbi:MAG: RNA polymerase sigma factor (sigma-70 family) [Chlamydiales bacterium]|jgi:RNA polymerase sigma factor (sigma-70 family)
MAMTDTSSIDVQTLVQHGEFLRALARSIVSDEHAADDVVQQSWVAALESPPGTVSSVKLWLGRVARNLALKSVTREREQRVRESEAAGSVLRAEEDATGDFELIGHVATALRALPEPYRSTIHMRYFKDLCPREIAVAEKVSLETVKTRLKRGLALLRADFDTRLGGRGAWFGALSALADPRVTMPAPAASGGLTATASILNGVALMKTLATTSAVLAAAVVTVLVVQRAPDAEPALEAIHAAAPAAPTPHDRPAQDLVATAALPVAESRAPVEPTPAAALADPKALGLRLGRLRVVDASNAPVPNVAFTSPSGEQQSTGVDGRAEFALATEARSSTITLSATGFLSSDERLAHGGKGDIDFGTFTLVRGGAIRGTVVDPDGAGVEGALVAVAGIDEDISGSTANLVDSSRGVPRPHAYTDRSGRFELVGIHPGTVRLWAGAAGLKDASSEAIDVAIAEQPEHVEIQLKAAALADEISGRVVLPPGVSSPDLSIWYSHDSFFVGQRTQSAPVAPDGSFRVQLEDRDKHDLWVVESLAEWDDRRQVWTGEKQLTGFRSTVARDVKPGTTHLILSFERTRQMKVEVTDPFGTPIDPFELLIYTRSGEDLAQERQWTRTLSHPASIDVPRTSFYAVVSADGFDYGAQGPFDLESAPPELRFELRSLPSKTGRVTAEGQPVAGATVELFALASPEHTIKSHGFEVRTDSSVSESASTSKEGDYALTVRLPGEYVLRAEAPGWAAAEIGPFEMDTSTSLDDLDLQLTQGGAIEGRVMLPDGADPSGWVVGASRGDIYGQTVTVGPDGRFRFDRLTPGPWWVGRMTGHHESASKRSARKKAAWTGNCAVELCETTRFNLDMRETRRTVITGFWKVGRLSMGAWTVRLRKGELENVDDLQDIDKATTSSEGAFSVVAPEPGDYLLLIQHNNFPEDGVMAIRPFYVDGDELYWSETIRLGELHARFDEGGPRTPADMPAAPRLAFIVPRNGGLTAAALLPDGEGLFTASSAPTGTGRIHYMTPATAEVPPFAWPVAAEAEVRMGETTAIE